MQCVTRKAQSSKSFGMKKCVMLVVGVLFATGSFAQGEKNPVSWSFWKKKMDATTYEIHLTAAIGDGWHTYSQTTPGGGPVPTAIEFIKNPLLILQGEAKENGKLEKHFEPLFNVEVRQFSDKVDFVQIVKVKGRIKANLAGTIRYMTCNDQQCLPPTEQKFSVTLD